MNSADRFQQYLVYASFVLGAAAIGQLITALATLN